MEWLPTAKAEVENFAFPLLSVPVPNTVVPFLNVTVPGVPFRARLLPQWL